MKPKVYVLLYRPEHDYTELHYKYEVHFMFHLEDIETIKPLEKYEQRIEHILERTDATDLDFLIPNGPGWLCTLIGPWWISQESTPKNMIIWCSKTKQYVELQ